MESRASRAEEARAPEEEEVTDMPGKSSDLRLKVEALMVKYPNRSFCEHDIASMLDVEDDEAPKIRNALANLKTYFFIENAASDTCSAREVPHSKYQATDKLKKKHVELPDEDEPRGARGKKRRGKRASAAQPAPVRQERSLGAILDEIEADVAEIRKRLETLR
jgi:hypothetical protein